MSGQFVLVAEDDTATAKVLWHVLVNTGFDATIATDGREAWEIAQAMQFDLIITDYQMPYLNGRELCELLRNSTWYSDTPIILTTAKCFELDVRQLQKDYNLFTVFQKPFSPTKVAKAATQCLSLHGMSTLSRESAKIPTPPVIPKA